MSKRQNECRTYFKIFGDFKVDDISNILNLQPEESWEKEDLRRDGKPYGFAHWSIGYCDEYNPYVYEQMRKTISPLLDKVDQLRLIKEKFRVDMYLVVVPKVYAESISPCLAPTPDIVEFLYKSKAELDIDLYTLK